jgi:hypothetical protein
LPIYLRKDTIRLIEASLECLQLAVIGLGVPKIQRFRDPASQLSGEIGLIGSAAELLVSACLVQVSGPHILLDTGGTFKSATQVIDEFRATLRARPPQTAVLTKGGASPDAQIASLDSMARKFKLLAKMRAGGLHAGRSPSRDVCVSLVNDVANFVGTLSESDRFRPYLEWVPRPIGPTVERAALISELQRRIEKSTNTAERAALTSEVFLVLPDLPLDAPDWLNAFNRVTVAPRESDVVFLLKTLEQAVPITLRRSKQGGSPIAVVVSPNDPNAIPIAPQYLRTEFTKAPDRFYADVANANGRLNEGLLDLPPESFVKELFTTGLIAPGILALGQTLTPHQAWPFICASLVVQGTPGPAWFIVRITSDSDQLIALLTRAGEIAKTFVKKRFSDFTPGIVAIRDASKVQKSGVWKDLLTFDEAMELYRSGLARKVRLSEQAKRRLPAVLETQVFKLGENDEPVGPVLLQIADAKTSLEQDVRGYWSRILSEAAGQADDVPGLLATLRNAKCGAAHSAARKALRYIDFALHGPTVESS